jgi:hypothetical protein
LLVLFVLSSQVGGCVDAAIQRIGLRQGFLLRSVSKTDHIPGAIRCTRRQIALETAGQTKRRRVPGEVDKHILDHVLCRTEIAQQGDGQRQQVVDVSLVNQGKRRTVTAPTPQGEPLVCEHLPLASP